MDYGIKRISQHSTGESYASCGDRYAKYKILNAMVILKTTVKLRVMMVVNVDG